VRSILVTHAAGKFYKLSRDDFQAWVFDRKQNARPPEAPPDPSRSLETPQDLKRPRETSHEVEGDATRIKELESENMQLKIDVGVRKQLLERAKEEMDEFRSMANNLLRENGALEYQLRQLAAPNQSRHDERPQPPAVSPEADNREAPPLVDTYPHHAGGAAQ
jgi:hypothetical protein